MSTLANAPAISGIRLRRHEAAFWGVAFSLLVMLAYCAVPTPLYPLYQQRDGFSSLMLTVIFSAYAVGVVISLFTVGHLSDWHGRRRLVVPALGVALASAVLFLVWRDVPGLILARFISGLGVGAITATATAWLAELHARSRPEASSRRAEVVATAANIGGIGVGPLVAGALAQWVGAPLTVPFLVSIAALLLALGFTLLSPETRLPVRPRPAYHPQRVAVPADARREYFAAAIAAAASFATFGLFTSLAPGFLAGTFRHDSAALAGATAFAVFAAGAVGQTLIAGRSNTATIATGGALALVGLAVVVAAVWLPSPSLALFLLGGVVAGAGSGCLFKGVMTQAAGLAAPERRAETLAGVFLAGYVGLSVPVVGLGLLTQHASSKVSLLVFAVVLAVAALLAMPFVWAAARRADRRTA